MSKIQVDNIRKADDTDIATLTANGIEVVAGKGIRADSLSDSAGTGPVDFPQGITSDSITDSAGTSGPAIKGTNTNDDAATGDIGEWVEITPGATSPSGSNTPTQLGSITLQPGDWDVCANVEFKADGISGSSYIQASLGTSNSVMDRLHGTIGTPGTSPASMSISNNRYSVADATTLTLYLMGKVNYSGLGSSTWDTATKIRARRVR